MIGERTKTALKRIDAAVARLEQGAARLKTAAGQQAERNAELTAAAAEQAERNAQLTAAAAAQAERHARLRDAVSEAMRDLDGLIGRAGATLASVQSAAGEDTGTESAGGEVTE